MRSIEETINALKNGEYDDKLTYLYSCDKNDVKKYSDRYIDVINGFEETFGKDGDIALFSAPGRTEIGGNHTDHQHGCVLAGSVNLDVISAARPNGTNTVRIQSRNYPLDVIELDSLEIREKEFDKAISLIRGVIKKFVDLGYDVKGFDAYTTSNVLKGSGLSSSAAFEVLVGTIINGLFANNEVNPIEIAKFGQFAENVYYNKPSGLMDQMACAVGGLIYIDFFDKANPVIKQVPVDFEAHQYSLCIVDTKGSHADLTDDYAAIPAEMKQVANYFGEELLSRVSEEDFISKVGEMRASGKVNDRAVLRALHFYTEQDRVAEGVAALENQEFDHFLDVIKRSGDSSFKLLQNIYSAKDPLTQNVSIALGFSEKFIGEDGVCRVHGGGFAGTIQAFVKNAAVAEYKKNIESIFGEGACHVLKVRPYGGIKVVE